MTFRKFRDLLLHRIGYALLRAASRLRAVQRPIAVSARIGHRSAAVGLAGFFFLQIGAFDGESRDPLFQAVRKYGLNGVLVEPQKPTFERLCENYRKGVSS